jgi:pimeloyl-ACP methyl ester carboxylesterase
MRKRPLAGRFVLLTALLLAPGCGSIPVRVERADPKSVHRELTATVLSTGKPSMRSVQFLERHGLRDRYADDPVGTLAEIHAGLGAAGDHRRLSALGELCFDHATRSGDRRYFVLAAAYSYALLFPGAGVETLDPSDPRVRLAYDLYNRGLTEALPAPKPGRVQFALSTRKTPIGTLELEFSEDEIYWAGHRLTDFVPAADYEVYGIRNRYRRPGIGAALSAQIGDVEKEGAVPAERFLPGIRVPATAFVRFYDIRSTLLTGELRGKIEIYTPDEGLSVAIDGRHVPLEIESTSALASTFAEATLWDFELRGFFSGAFRPLRKAVTDAVAGQPSVAQEAGDEGLMFVHPYRRGRIPLVLVHGTASSPARWADLVNEVENDRLLWDRYQIWLFLYNTGNPIGYSGGLLRRSLERAVQELDPEGTDEALRRMVVIGHSQGGLLAKLTAVDSGSRFWSVVSETPPEQLDLDPDVRTTLKLGTFFTPEPFVKRVVFVCTPHRGSYLASFSIAGLVSDFVSAPSNLTQVFTELVTRNEDKLLVRNLARLPTSIDNMTPGNPFIKTLVDLPVAPGIHAHSIIAVKGGKAGSGGSDGVVRYDSAHLDGVGSEFIVDSSHSAQSLPATIEEVRRILLLHARDAAAPAGPAAAREEP